MGQLEGPWLCFPSGPACREGEAEALLLPTPCAGSCSLLAQGLGKASSAVPDFPAHGYPWAGAVRR